jgi:hypothetical protein
MLAWVLQTATTHSVNVEMDGFSALQAGKFAWQLLWTGGDESGVGSTGPHPIVTNSSCASDFRSLCIETAPPQTRAMMFVSKPCLLE